MGGTLVTYAGGGTWVGGTFTLVVTGALGSEVWQAFDSTFPFCEWTDNGSNWNGQGTLDFGQVSPCAGPTDLTVECAD